MKADKTITRLIKQYDNKLYIQWNYEKSYFEVWRTMPWGDRLILPVTKKMLDGVDDYTFTPLDNRTLDWLYYADSQRKDLNNNYKWLIKKRKEKEQQLKKQRSRRETEDFFKDYMNILNNARFTAFTDVAEEGEWIAPDVKAKHNKRLHYRSADNAKKYFGDKK